MCEVLTGRWAEGRAPRPDSPGGRQALHFRSSLLFSTFSRHTKGQRKLLRGQTSEHLSLQPSLRVQAPVSGLEAQPLSQQPGCAKKALNISRLLNPNLPAPLPSHVPEIPGDALSKPYKQQRAEVQGRSIYLTLSTSFSFLKILFKLKLSKVVPDKSEG